MTLLALGTPTVFVPDPTYTTPALPAGTAIGANTGFTFVNSPEGLVYVVIQMGSTAANYTVVATLAGVSNIGPKALTVSVPNVIGPFDPAQYSAVVTGLVTVNLSSVTGITGVAAVIMSAGAPAGTMRAAHNPFEMNPGAQDR